MSQPRSPKNPPNKLFKDKQWQQCYEHWLRAIYEHSGSRGTLRLYGNVIRDFFRDARSPDDYRRADVEAFVRREVVRHGVPRSANPGTQNGRLTVLRSFYSYAAQYDVPFRKSVRPLLHTPDPTRGMQMVKIGRRRRDLTEDELKRLFAAIPRDTVQGKRDFALFSFYFWTARRRSEIVRLRWSDIFEVVFVEGGRPRQGHMYQYSPKGHSREVFTAELPQPAWIALKDYLIAAGRWETMQPESPLFVRLDYARKAWEPERSLNGSAINHLLAKYVRSAGIDVGGTRQICVHSLRHTRARLQWRREKDILKIKELLGHSNLSSTQIYLLDAEDKADSGAYLLASELGQL